MYWSFRNVTSYQDCGVLCIFYPQLQSNVASFIRNYRNCDELPPFCRTLHGKTGELTTQVNNLHNAVAKIQAGGSVGASSGGGISRQEFNSLLHSQNELKSAVYNIK